METSVMLSNEPRILKEEKLPRLVKFDVVPDNVLIARCPKLGGKKTYAKSCLECKYSDGWLQIDNTGNFTNDYRAFCCHAMPKILEEIG